MQSSTTSLSTTSLSTTSLSTTSLSTTFYAFSSGIPYNQINDGYPIISIDSKLLPENIFRRYTELYSDKLKNKSSDLIIDPFGHLVKSDVKDLGDRFRIINLYVNNNNLIKIQTIIMK